MKHNGVGQASFGSDGVSPSYDGGDAIAPSAWLAVKSEERSDVAIQAPMGEKPHRYAPRF
ncbi:hypothetical protein AGMMS49545_08770 [Betaproteobacteria bacterium]|nr:hypothetical protein AGMMS49545_08770 [Betaproteobacteria bacterium]GHU41304.1 hypothetical protein AGMMS50289_04230 [Betaproteobacteria bacterium]